jgi:enoyl-CoA hydratase/carnithine racemase
MSSKTIQYVVKDSVAEILFNNPPVNGLSHEVMDALMAALSRARDDAQVRAVIIASAIPGRFCGGLDLGVFLDSTPAQKHAMVNKLYAKLCDVQFDLGKPCIAAITGAARGGGMSLAISCDMIVAADNATFGYPEIEIGLLPAIHYTHLPRIVGRYRAFDLLFTGRAFGAHEALDIGLISRSVPEAWSGSVRHTRAPKPTAASTMRGSSVATMTSPMPAAQAWRQTRSIMVIPASRTSGLPGSRVEA